MPAGRFVVCAAVSSGGTSQATAKPAATANTALAYHSMLQAAPSWSRTATMIAETEMPTPTAREMHGGERTVARGAQPVDDEGGAEDQREGARRTGHETQADEDRHRGRNAHAGEAYRSDREGSQQPEAARARQAHGRQQRAREVAQEVRRRDQPGLRLGERQGLDHGRQDRRIDEAAGADTGRQRQQAAETERECTFVHCRRGSLGCRCN